jgi:hypothetical protein
MKTKTHFAFRVDIWDDTGDSIVEHVAGVDDFEVAEATYRAAVARGPAARITLRQGARVIEDSKRKHGHFSREAKAYWCALIGRMGATVRPGEAPEHGMVWNGRACGRQYLRSAICACWVSDRFSRPSLTHSPEGRPVACRAATMSGDL